MNEIRFNDRIFFIIFYPKVKEFSFFWINNLTVLLYITAEYFFHIEILLSILLNYSGPVPVAWCIFFFYFQVFQIKSTSILNDATLVIKKSCTSMRLRRFITGLTTRWLFRTYASCWHGTSQVFNEYIILRHHSAYIIYLHGFTKSLDWAYYSTFLHK